MEDNKGINTIQKVWISGTTLVTAIPRRIREVLNINKGDYIEIIYGKVVKEAEKDSIKKKKIIKVLKETEPEISDENLPDMEE